MNYYDEPVALPTPSETLEDLSALLFALLLIDLIFGPFPGAMHP